MKRALLIIDVQKSAVNDLDKALKIEKLQQRYETIFISKFVNEDSYLIKFGIFDGYEDEGLVFFPLKRAKIFSKNGYSSFLPEMKNFDTIDICGFDTDACVYKTAMDLIEEGVRPNILLNLCGSADKELHETAIKFLERNIGKENIDYSLF